MIQFNLLPDVKLAYIKAKRIEHLAVTISGAVIIASAVVLIAMFSIVDGLQKHSLNSVNNDIAKYEAQIKSTPSLNKLLTIQNQLNTLPKLDAQKPVASRIFDYISQLTPQQVDLSTLNLDFSKHTITISGKADSLSTIDQFVDTLKFTTYNISGLSSNPHAFSSVVLSSFGSTSQSSSFSITANFDPVIFSEANNTPQLTVPNEVTTRSRSSQELPLFTGNNNPNTPTVP
jgi:hypothetical protein